MFLCLFSPFNNWAQDSCLVFDGTNDYVYIPAINLTDSAEITIEAWVKPDRLTHRTSIEIIRQNGRNSGGSIPAAWLLAFKSRGKTLTFGINTKSGYKELHMSINASDYVGKWTHVAGTYDGSKMRIFVNGVLRDSTTYSGLIEAATPTTNRIGVSVRAEWFDGKIDEVREWHRALTARELKRNKDCAITSARPGLLAVYNFNDGKGTTTRDASGNARHGGLRNGPVWDTSTVATLCKCRTPNGFTQGTLCDSVVSPSGRHVWKSLGYHFDTLLNANGCDSVIRVNLTSGDSTYYRAVVACDSSLSPSGLQWLKVSGTYRDTFLNAVGCDSIITTKLTLFQTKYSSIKGDSCLRYTSPSGKYQWYKSGTYSDTLSTWHGCDSVITIDLIIRSDTAHTRMVASNCNSYRSPSGKYIWHSSGRYLDTLKNIDGCDSFLLVDLTIYGQTSSRQSLVVCDSMLSPSGTYVWRNSGTYTDTLTSFRNCDSVVTIDLTVGHPSSNRISVQSCGDYTSPSGKYIWTVSGTYTDTLINRLGCDSILTIDLLNTMSFRRLVKRACHPFSFTSPSGKYVWDSTGTYFDTLVNFRGCDSVITIELYVLKDITSTVRRTACKEYVSPSGKYTWTQSGIYEDIIPSVLGCDSLIRTFLTIRFDEEIKINRTQCGDFESPSGNYTWTKSGIYRDTLMSYFGCDSVLVFNLTLLQSDTIFADTACGRYTSPSGKFVWTESGTFKDVIPNSFGCDSDITVQLHINPIQDTILDTFSCVAIASPSGKYFWTESGNYKDTIATLSGCDSILTIRLHLPKDTSVKLSSCEPYLSPSGRQLWSSSGTYQDTIPSSTGCDSIIIANFVRLNPSRDSLQLEACEAYTSPSGRFTWDSSGIFMDTITNYHGCDSVLVINLRVHNVQAELGPDSTLCRGKTLLLTLPQDSGAQYLWSDGSKGHSIVVAESGTYWVKLTEENCSASDTIRIKVDEACECGVFIPTTFSPGSSPGINDQFQVVSECSFTEYRFMIFDRWGSILFESDHIEDEWDGTKKGKYMIPGAYYYIFTATTVNGEEHEDNGIMVIVR